MLDLLFFLFLGHIFGDFAFQSDRMASEKTSSRKVLTCHAIIYTLTVAVFLFLGLLHNNSDAFLRVSTLVIMIFLFVEHWLQDYAKAGLFNSSKQGFYLDQALHLLLLLVIRVLVYNG
ncbi:MAG: DUF3307 domain-containing protein [candidate division Zixibacteria bacterium]|nr:DUF3307 domain-containing protein [candidate division Zixibacteria bacterium]